MHILSQKMRELNFLLQFVSKKIKMRKVIVNQRKN